MMLTNLCKIIHKQAWFMAICVKMEVDDTKLIVQR